MKTQFIGPIRQVLHGGKVLLYGSDSDSGNAPANPTDFKGIKGSSEGVDFVGNEFRIPIEARRNNSVGFRSENETLPAPGSGQYTYITDQLRYDYALFNITGPLMQAATAGQGAFATAFQTGMESTTLAAKLDLNRAAFGDSSGKLCAITVGGVTGDTQLTVDSTINFRGGEVVDVVTSAGVVVSAALTITAVNRATKVLSTDHTLGATVATTCFPVKASSDSTISVPNNSQNKEINGLGNIVLDSGTLHGLSPTAYTFWKSGNTAVGGPLSDSVLQAARDGIAFESGLDLEAGVDFAMLTTRGVRSRYAQTLTSLKRFADAQLMTMNGGFTALQFEGNPIFTDDQCPIGVLWGLSINRLMWIQGADWSWMEQDGQVLKWEPRRDRYIAVLYSYLNLGTTQRGAHFRLTGITDDSR